jgi:predicted Zn-dependent protease
MLFDLRSRGRRRTVQAVYLGLALLMGGGLVLFGVGAGNGFGGILNAFTGGGSSGAQTQVVSQAEKTALQQTRLHPTDPAGWAALVQARWTEAGQGNNYDTSTGTFTAAGKKELAGATQAWERYLQLTKQPDPNLAILAARAYAAGGNYSGEASAWEIETLANPNEAKGYECLAASAYAAKQTRKGDLATAKALSLVPKLSRATLKTQLQQAKTQPQVAQEC